MTIIVMINEDRTLSSYELVIDVLYRPDLIGPKETIKARKGIGEAQEAQVENKEEDHQN